MTVLPYQHKASIVASVLTVIEIFQIPTGQERAPITLLFYFIALLQLWPGVRASARWFALAKLIIFSKCKSSEFYTTMLIFSDFVAKVVIFCLRLLLFKTTVGFSEKKRSFGGDSQKKNEELHTTV